MLGFFIPGALHWRVDAKTANKTQAGVDSRPHTDVIGPSITMTTPSHRRRFSHVENPASGIGSAPVKMARRSSMPTSPVTPLRTTVAASPGTSATLRPDVQRVTVTGQRGRGTERGVHQPEPVGMIHHDRRRDGVAALASSLRLNRPQHIHLVATSARTRRHRGRR